MNTNCRSLLHLPAVFQHMPQSAPARIVRREGQLPVLVHERERHALQADQVVLPHQAAGELVLQVPEGRPPGRVADTFPAALVGGDAQFERRVVDPPCLSEQEVELFFLFGRGTQHLWHRVHPGLTPNPCIGHNRMYLLTAYAIGVRFDKIRPR